MSSLRDFLDWIEFTNSKPEDEIYESLIIDAITRLYTPKVADTLFDEFSETGRPKATIDFSDSPAIGVYKDTTNFQFSRNFFEKPDQYVYIDDRGYLRNIDLERLVIHEFIHVILENIDQSYKDPEHGELKYGNFRGRVVDLANELLQDYQKNHDPDYAYHQRISFPGRDILNKDLVVGASYSFGASIDFSAILVTDPVYGDQGYTRNFDTGFTAKNTRDLIIGKSEGNEIKTHGGNDFIWGFGGNDRITAGQGSDFASGGLDNDVFFAGRGQDIYHGGFKSLDVGLFRFAGGAHELDYEADGYDTVSYQALNASGAAIEVTVVDQAKGKYFVDKFYGGTLHRGAGDRDTLYSIESLLGVGEIYRFNTDPGGEIREGTNEKDRLGAPDPSVAYTFSGKGGDDFINGGNLGDLIIGGKGNDYLTGKRGDDVYEYSYGDGHDIINDYGYAMDNDTLMLRGINPLDVTLGRYNHASKVTVTISGDEDGSIELWGQTGAGGIDYIVFDDGTILDMQGTLVPLYGTDGRNFLFGANDNPYREGVLIDDWIIAGGGNDRVYGGKGNDTSQGGLGNDHIVSGFGNDVSSGGGGNDIILGNNGDDWLIGGPGADQLYGGSNSDTFVFDESAAVGGHDTVRDFALHESDRLDVSDALEFYGYNRETHEIDDFVRITEDAQHSYLQLGSSGTFVTVAQLTGVRNLPSVEALEASGVLITDSGTGDTFDFLDHVREQLDSFGISDLFS